VGMFRLERVRVRKGQTHGSSPAGGATTLPGCRQPRAGLGEAARMRTGIGSSPGRIDA
jgi:hypothetical protein